MVDEGLNGQRPVP